VTFFAAPELAERAGFRPCRRCRPHDTEADPPVALVVEACRLLDQRGSDPVALDALAGKLAATPARLRRAFHTVLGLTPRQYRDARRLERLKDELRRGRRVSPALYAAGYGAPSRLYERARARLGMTPATYGKGGLGARIHYAVARTELGELLVARTEHGVCRVSLGDSRHRLERELRFEFPTADLVPDEPGLRSIVGTLRAHLAGSPLRSDLPLDVRGTAFQWQVWTALRAIPYGATHSYSAIARAIGRPGSARAVARACASNPTALLIPCHRVVPADGTSGGYRWGVQRKRVLLAKEARRRTTSPVTSPAARSR
jgi:AraC family transcriptional regulator of adaptative response/methylated-DNA-[protein]-cysteine methyltransferase